MHWSLCSHECVTKRSNHWASPLAAGTLGLTYAHSFIHELTERYHTAGSCCGLPSFCLVWIIPHALIIPCFPRHSWGLGAARLAGQARVVKPWCEAGRLSPPGSPCWQNDKHKEANIKKQTQVTSGHPGMTDYPLEDSITHCLQLHPAYLKTKQRSGSETPGKQ